MQETARATSLTSSLGSDRNEPSACSVPAVQPHVISALALPMSIWPQAMWYFRPSSEVDFLRPVIACLVAV
jgi:hypothetical protein